MNEEIKVAPYEVLAETIPTEIIPDGVKIIQADKFWIKGDFGNGVKIAILDTGCDINHPDLKNRIVGVRNFTKDDNYDKNNVTDYEGHGTHVAGIIAADADGKGIVGVAPKANLLILKVLSKGGGSYNDITKAVEYAITEKVDIISMSLGGSYNDKGLQKAIKKAVDQDILVVCAAGNDGDSRGETIEINYPAAYNESISVGSVNVDKIPSRFTSSNAEVDLVAPGQGFGQRGILSTMPGGKYAEMSGTSMACPHVAGALALLINWGKREFKRKLTEEELYSQLIKRTLSLGYHRWIEGNGMLCLTLEEIITKTLKSKNIFEMNNERL